VPVASDEPDAVSVMKTNSFLLLIVLVTAALLLPGWVAARPIVSHIRCDVSDGQSRVVIDLSERVPYEVVSVKNPERIAINLPKSSASGKLRAMTVSDGVVSRVRINRLSWGTQVVLDLRGEARWSDLFLVSVDNMPNRIVLDVEAPASSRSSRAASTPATPVTPSASSRRAYVIAIDAGHGGSDPGAVGRYDLVEKREALDIAKRVAVEINARTGYRAVLTRDRDVFLSLPSRIQVAKKKGADIFVSIHLNSAPKKDARGIEVFFLSPSGAQSTASRFLANKDRAAAELGVDGSGNDDILHMLVDVNQQSMMQRSSLLAEEILQAMRQPGLPPTRSVKQRSFAVFKSIDMPSVMVETGFVTNSKDAKILKSNGGKTKTARAIADGVLKFMKKYPPPDETGQLVVHQVRKGDTLWKISRKYNTSVASIQKSNRMGNSKMIRVGQELVVREGHETY
jgi:N-acetylmuramoyl-L-alanine amidase